MSGVDKESRILQIAADLKAAESLNEFHGLLRKIETIDVIKSSEIRDALESQARKVFCLIRRSRIEGREPPNLKWIVPSEEFLGHSITQNEMRRLKTIDEIFTEFSLILNSKRTSEIEIRETLRVINTTPILVDYAFDELHKSSLGGLIRSLEGAEDFLRHIQSTLNICSVLRNRKIMELVNSRASEIEKAIIGRKNPELAITLLGAIASLPGSPWSSEEDKGLITFDNLQQDLQKAIMGRFSKIIPRKEQIDTSTKDSDSVSIKQIEEMIQKLGWPFTRIYLENLAKVKEVSPDSLYPIILSQEPMGRIQPNYILFCLRNGIPLPYQLLESAIGRAAEYVLDFDIIEAEYDIVEGFEANCPDYQSLISSKNIREHHLINGRTGLRLDETYLGAKGIVRTLLDRGIQIANDIATQFLKDLVVTPTIPMAIKRRAKDSLERTQNL